MKAIFDCLRKIGIGRLSRAKRLANKKLSNIATASDVVEAVGIDSAMTISVDGIRLITSL